MKYTFPESRFQMQRECGKLKLNKGHLHAPMHQRMDGSSIVKRHLDCPFAARCGKDDILTVKIL